MIELTFLNAGILLLFVCAVILTAVVMIIRYRSYKNYIKKRPNVHIFYKGLEKTLVEQIKNNASQSAAMYERSYATAVLILSTQCCQTGGNGIHAVNDMLHLMEGRKKYVTNSFQHHTEQAEHMKSAELIVKQYQADK